MKWFKRQWDSFRAKSLWGKFWDVLFIGVIILLIIPDGRILVQRMILKTGLFGNTSVNVSDTLDASAADWKLMDLEGRTTTFGTLNDKKVFLNFWATWCPPCKAEMPSIQALISRAEKHSNFILVSHEEPEKVKAFLRAKKWDLPVYFPLDNTPVQLQAASLPTTFVIDSDGIIIHKSEGMRDWSSEEAVELMVGTSTQ